MCVIIDANFAHLISSSPPDIDFIPVKTWLLDKDGCLVTGGKLSEELYKLKRVKHFILTLSRAGKAKIYPFHVLNAEKSEISKLGINCSDDLHIIALARISGARTLCSRDKNLHKDFKNTTLINNPKGKIYQNQGHEHLLQHTPSCEKHI